MCWSRFSPMKSKKNLLHRSSILVDGRHDVSLERVSCESNTNTCSRASLQGTRVPARPTPTVGPPSPPKRYVYIRTLLYPHGCNISALTSPISLGIVAFCLLAV